MIQDAIVTCAQWLTFVSLIYHTEPTTKKWKTEKLKSKTDKPRSIGKQSGESVESVPIISCLINPESRLSWKRGG